MEYLGGPEKGLWGYETHTGWLATEETAAVEALLWLLRLLNDLCCC